MSGQHGEITNTILTQLFQSPYGTMIIGAYKDQICLCDWQNRAKRSRVDRRLQQGLGASYTQQSSALIEQAKSQLNEFFNAQRQLFDLPLLLEGTPFQRSVWQHLRQIPFGKTISYQQLASINGNIKAVRAVANANAANAISIIIPCHRVISSRQQSVGYAGGKNTQRTLIQLEETALHSPRGAT